MIQRKPNIAQDVFPLHALQLFDEVDPRGSKTHLIVRSALCVDGFLGRSPLDFRR